MYLKNTIVKYREKSTVDKVSTLQSSSIAYLKHSLTVLELKKIQVNGTKGI